MGTQASREGHEGRLSDRDRSEEHTSELQSLAYLVCRLLLEKKKHIRRFITPSDKTLPMRASAPRLPPVTSSSTSPRSFTSSEDGSSWADVVQTSPCTSPSQRAVW